MTDNSICLEIIKSLILTCNKVALYARNHPIVKSSLLETYKLFQNLPKQFSKLTFSLKSDTILFNDAALPKNAMGIEELVKKFKDLEIDSISFLPNLEEKELEDFLTLLSCGKKLEAKEAGIKKDLASGSYAHIKANVIRYEKVEEGEKVVSELTKEAEDFLKESEKSIGAGTKDKFLEIFNSFLCGKVDAEQLEEYKKDVISKIIKEPGSLVDIVIKAAIACGSFNKVFSKLKSSILQDLAVEFIDKKKKPDRMIASLLRALDVTLEDEKIADQIKASKKEVDEILSEFYQELKVGILARLFEINKEDSDKFLKRSASFLSEADFAKITDKLTGALLLQGLKKNEIDELLAKMQSSFESKEKVSISKTEYEQLKNKADLFDKNIVDRINEATVELRKKNKRLADEKERVDTVIRNLAEGLIVVDKQGKLVMINPAAEQLLGIEKNQKLGQPLTESLSSNQLVALTKGSLADEEGAFSKEIELKSTDEQTKKVLRASTAVVENENGSTVGMVMVLSDVTRQRQIEKLKSDFVAKMSHELRTPIIAAQKSISLILTQTAGQVNEDQNKFLNIANSNLTRLSRLINEILDLAKIESGKLKVNIAVFDMVELIKEVTQTLSSWATDKNINLVCDVAMEKLDIEADRDKINQVITNLAGNAIKFTPQSGTVTISCREIDKDNVQVDINDNGIGITKEDCKRLFKKFEQVSLVSPAGVGGTGLGLFISKEIIEMHKGNIWVESVIEKGSTFSFTLPKKFVAEEPQENPDTPKDTE